MKKILAISCILSFGLNAQSVSTMIKSAVTMTNSTATTATLQTIVAHQNVCLQAVVTKSTGTIAGTVTVAGSIDGTNYITFGDSAYLADVTTNTHLWALTNNDYLYYKMTFLGTGTMVATPVGKVYTNGSGSNHYVTNMLSPFSAVKDTTDNTSTSYVSLEVTKWYDDIAIQSVVTKISGTVAGTVTLQGSLDGTNYNTVNSSYANVTSYVPTNVTANTKIFVVTGSPYRYYRLSYAGAGTMSASHRGYVLPNKK
ncbi:MAG: hypothetical protein V4538_15560 [Bacteroidota bacterium]